MDAISSTRPVRRALQAGAAVLVAAAVWLPAAVGAGEGDVGAYGPGSAVPTTVVPGGQNGTNPPTEANGTNPPTEANGTNPPTEVESNGGSLPFTGGDVAGLVIIAGAALVGGSVLVRVGRRRGETRS